MSAVRPVPLEIPRPPYVDSRGREGLVAWQWQWLVDVGWVVGGLGWVGLVGGLVGWLVTRSYFLLSLRERAWRL